MSTISVCGQSVGLAGAAKGGDITLPRSSADMHARTGCPEKKLISAQSRYVKRTEVEFLFGDRKPIFPGIHGLHFLSDGPWEIINFLLICLISC